MNYIKQLPIINKKKSSCPTFLQVSVMSLAEIIEIWQNGEDYKKMLLFFFLFIYTHLLWYCYMYRACDVSKTH